MTDRGQLFFFNFLVISGILIRVWLFNNKFMRIWFEQRLEISTPLTSWSRVLEGVYLKKQFPNYVYNGDLVHEIPLMLNLYDWLISLSSLNYISYLFIGLDVLNAVIIQSITKKIIAYLIELGNFYFLYYNQTLKHKMICSFLFN